MLVIHRTYGTSLMPDFDAVQCFCAKWFWLSKPIGERMLFAVSIFFLNGTDRLTVNASYEQFTLVL